MPASSPRRSLPHPPSSFHLTRARDMKYLTIRARSDGASFLTNETWPLHEADFTPPSPSGYRTTDKIGARGVLMMHHPAGYRDAWHCAPVPVLGTVLTGFVSIQTGDGDARVLSPGHQFVAADLTGNGHKMEEVSGGPYDLILVVLDALPSRSAGRVLA